MAEAVFSPPFCIQQCSALLWDLDLQSLGGDTRLWLRILCILGALDKFDLPGLVLPASDYAFWEHWDCLTCEELFCLPAIMSFGSTGTVSPARNYSTSRRSCGAAYSLVPRGGTDALSAVMVCVVARGAPFITLGLCSICFRWKRTSG